MKLIIEGEPKEIAALMFATQERQNDKHKIALFLDGEKITQHTIDVLKREMNVELRRGAKFVYETADGPCLGGVAAKPDAKSGHGASAVEMERPVSGTWAPTNWIMGQMQSQGCRIDRVNFRTTIAMLFSVVSMTMALFALLLFLGALM